MKTATKFGILLIALCFMLTIRFGVKLNNTRMIVRSDLHSLEEGVGKNEERIVSELNEIKQEPGSADKATGRAVFENKTDLKAGTRETPRDAISKSINEGISHQTKFKSSPVYSVDVLRRELKSMHDKLYRKQSNGSCNVRPVGCVILGVAKSGTQELLEFLSIHPNVVPKHDLPNPNLFDVDAHLVKAKEKMPCTYPDQIGIAKTDYFFFRNEMPGKFFHFNKDLKMILIVREPIERLISAYTFTYSQKKQHKLIFTYKLQDIPEIDHVFLDTSNGSVKTDQFDLKHSVYDVPMERYLELFSKEQILVIESSEFRNQPVKVLQRVERFLGLKPVISEDHFVFNQDKNFYCLQNNKNMFCYGSDRGRTKLKELKPETKKTLLEYFKPHNERFFKLIGQKFEW